MTDFSNTKVRCSAIGLIMCEPNGKTPFEQWKEADDYILELQNQYDELDEKKKTQKPALRKLEKIQRLKSELIDLELKKDDEILSDGCKTYLTRLYAWEKYHKWSATKDIGNKYTTKGKLVEEDSIDLLCKVEKKMLKKNEDRIENEFICGTPDLFEGESIYNADKIIDIKSSWDIETFFSNLGKPLKQIYWFQVQGYMAISGANTAEVVFCLVSTPDSILNDEKYRLFKRLNPVTELDPQYLIEEAELINNMTFDDIPPEERIIKFIVPRDEKAINRIYKKVADCREWLKQIESLHLSLQNT